MPTFHDYFASLWTTPQWSSPSPFPWQEMLATRATWPQAIELPTASGKTACIDAAVYRMASGATGSEGMLMPRRLWFVVDRRIVVDEAFQRASRIADKLQAAQSGPLKEIADQLRNLGGTGTPLAVARMRGGTWRDDKGWASDPRQPAIICTTVDQIGSSLLFRAYGHSDLTASVYAGLAGNDSLVILDEAHCSEPFRQTLESISQFRQQPWSAEPPPVPFAYTIMSATLPESFQEQAFPTLEERDAALDHDALHERRDAEKWASLHLVKASGAGDALCTDAANAARSHRGQGRSRIAVMVNRVATARQIFTLLDQPERDYDVVLITGRMRPMDRDKLIAKWSPILASSPEREPDRPVIVVTTQCLEVGADFSFDAIVTECASLDALRQRFGRLDRLGKLGRTEATILLRAEHAKEPSDKEADPIYGKAIFHTWAWLNEVGETAPAAPPPVRKRAKRGAHAATSRAPSEPIAEKWVNFGIASIGTFLSTLTEVDEQADPEQRRLPRMLAPQPDAPILLPGHLDILCQTGPRSKVEPDISLYLHGKGRSSAEVCVVFRCDYPDENLESYLRNELPLLPPTSPEALSVPLHRLRQWLIDQSTEDTTGDVEGEASIDDADSNRSVRRTISFIRWRGRKKSKVGRRATDLCAGDVIVLPARREIFSALGQLPDQPEAAGEERLDLAEISSYQAKGRVILRLSDEVWEPWKQWPMVQALLECAKNDEAERNDLVEAIAALWKEQKAAWREAKTASFSGTNNAEPSLERELLPVWLLQLITRILHFPFQLERTRRGLVLVSKRHFRQKGTETDPFDEDDADERSRSRSNTGEVSLNIHTFQVQQLASHYAANRWPEISDDVNRAAFAHDLGKLDPRFQVMLRGGDYIAFGAEPLAKSPDLPASQAKRIEIEKTLRLPYGFRHEMLSAQLAQQLSIANGHLALHLITSHHGHSRPFAPVVDDTVENQLAAGPLLTPSLQLAEVSAEQRSGMKLPHDLANKHADRFWQLTRRHGWWGLAYAESILRLADWRASATPETGSELKAFPPPPNAAPHSPSRRMLDLPGIDGSNPLGALAALGVLRCLTQGWPKRDVRLHWRVLSGGWKAVVSFDDDPAEGDPAESVVTALAEVLKLGFKAKTEGFEIREQAQRELEALESLIKSVKDAIKKRKLKGGAKLEAENAELHPLEERKVSLHAVIIDPIDTAKKAFDNKNKETKNAVKALKKRKLKGAELKAEKAKFIAPLQAELEQSRLAWLVLLRGAVPFREMSLGKRADVSAGEYRDIAQQMLAAHDWPPVEMLCHFGSDGATNRNITTPTQLSFINGSGHQFFLETALELTKCVTLDKLRSALFLPWIPEDEKYSMRWLPSEDRRYALMANNPSGGEKTLTIWAANLLGYAGLGLLPSAPGMHSLETTGLIHQENKTAFTWPLWEAPLTDMAVSSLFAQTNQTSLASSYRRAMRIEVGEGTQIKVNFTPSVAC